MVMSLRRGLSAGAVRRAAPNSASQAWSSPVDEVALRYDARESLYAQQAQKFQVFECLRHRPVVCRHYQHAEVDATDPGYHGVYEAVVTRHINKANGLVCPGFSKCVSEFYGQPPLFLFRQPVRVCPGQALYQAGFAVVHMTCCGD